LFFRYGGSGFLFILIRTGLITDLHRIFFRLAKHGKEKAFSSRPMGKETIYREVFVINQVACEIPKTRHIHRKYLCAEFIAYPADIPFILFYIICTSTIN